MQEVHAGEGHGEDTQDHVRHGQVQDEDVPGVGLNIVHHRGYDHRNVTQQPRNCEADVDCEKQIVPGFVYSEK